MSYPEYPTMGSVEPSYPPYPTPQGYGGVPANSQPMGMSCPHVGPPHMEQSTYPPGPPGGGYPPGPPGGGYPPGPPGGGYPPGPPGGGFGPPGGGYPPGPGFGPPPGAGYGPPPGAGYGPPPGPGYGPPPGAGYGPPPGAGFGQPMGGGYPPGGEFGAPAIGMSPYPGGHPNHNMGMPMAVAAAPIFMEENRGMAHHPSAPDQHHVAESHVEKHEEHKDEGTIKPHEHFEPKEDAAALKKAMKGFGTNEKVIIEILSNRSCAQRIEILKDYKAVFGKDLISAFKKELTGEFQDVVLAMMKSIARLLAEALRKAMQGIGTRERIIIEILCTATNKEIHEINEAYREDYGKPLEKDIKGDTSSYMQNLLVAINMGRRSENHDVHHEKAKKDAEALYKAGEKKWGTNESVFTSMLASESYPQLRCVFEEYEKLSKHPFETALKKEFSGSLLDAMLTIVKCVRNKELYFAEEIHSTFKGMGTRDHSLIRLIISRSEKDLKPIKEYYEKQYKKSLHSAISSETNGNYKKMLLAIVKE